MQSFSDWLRSAQDAPGADQLATVIGQAGAAGGVFLDRPYRVVGLLHEVLHDRLRRGTGEPGAVGKPVQRIKMTTLHDPGPIHGFPAGAVFGELPESEPAESATDFISASQPSCSGCG
jgi:hypothetical protein